MSAGAIGGVSELFGSGDGLGSGNKFAELSSEEFIRILTSELTNQDPMEPNDSAKILEQLSSLRNIESQMELQNQMESLVRQNQVAQASGLIGQTVEGLDLESNRISGLVTSVRVVQGHAMLELDTGQTMPMGLVERIVGDPGSTPEE